MEGTAATQIERDFELRAETLRKRSISAIKCGIRGIDPAFLTDTACAIEKESRDLCYDLACLSYLQSAGDKPERERRETSDALESVTIRTLRELRLALRLRCDILKWDNVLEWEDRCYARATTEILGEIVDLAIHRHRFGLPYPETIVQRLITGDDYVELLKKAYVFACEFSNLIDRERIFRYRPLQRVIINDLLDFLACEIKVTRATLERWRVQ